MDLLAAWGHHGLSEQIGDDREGTVLQQNQPKTQESSVPEAAFGASTVDAEGSSRPLVTVVVPAYNAAAFVGDAVWSALRQTYARLEVIVVDDGSTDGTQAVLGTIRDPRLGVFRTANRGAGAARNTGWRTGRGELVAFLDADDIWLPRKIEEQVAFLSAHSEVGLVGSKMWHMAPSGRRLGITGTMLDDQGLERVRRAQLMPFPLSSVVVRRWVLSAVGGFDEGPALATVEDLDFVARACRVTKAACVTQILGMYRLTAGSLSARHFRSQRLGTRYVQERLKVEDDGRELDWETFRASCGLSWCQRWQDFVRGTYRRAGVYAAEGKWLSAIALGAVALVLGPRYTLRRFYTQQAWRALVGAWNRIDSM